MPIKSSTNRADTSFNLGSGSVEVNKPSWEEKIRQDYAGILSKEQIETTIEYWSQTIKEERQQVVLDYLSKNTAYTTEQVIREQAVKEERLRILKALPKAFVGYVDDESKGFNECLEEIKKILK